jgi:hypothetical protein
MPCDGMNHVCVQAKTRLGLTPLMSAVEKHKVETIRFLADSHSPPFVLPGEPNDFLAECPPPSSTLAKFLKSVPPRPGQAIQKSADVRQALGPRPRPQHAHVQQQELVSVKNDREMTLNKRREEIEQMTTAGEGSKVLFGCLFRYRPCTCTPKLCAPPYTKCTHDML